MVSLLLFSVWAAGAAERPVAVSPGNATGSLIGDTCPTFSWGDADGAKSYDLVVYRVGDKSEEAKPVFRKTLAGSASSWTPSLDLCLRRGGRFAWSVRSVSRKGESEWSIPRLFEVASGPSEVEFEEAVEIVRRYLADETPGSTDGSRESPQPSSDRGSATVPTAVILPSPLSVAVGDSTLQVNGSPVLTEATLAGSCLGRRWLDQGDGTVVDCNTRKIWLKDAGCLGEGTWGFVQAKVADLNDTSWGTDFGCVEYTEGNHTTWRVPTITELCSAGPWVQVCPAANGTTSLVDTRFFGSPKVSNGLGTGGLTDGNPFVGVQSDFPYWSSTEIPGVLGVGAGWYVFLGNGDVDVEFKDQVGHVWPVRSGGFIIQP
jgi:hypothetical protein